MTCMGCGAYCASRARLRSFYSTLGSDASNIEENERSIALPAASVEAAPTSVKRVARRGETPAPCKGAFQNHRGGSAPYSGETFPYSAGRSPYRFGTAVYITASAECSGTADLYK